MKRIVLLMLCIITAIVLSGCTKKATVSPEEAVLTESAVIGEEGTTAGSEQITESEQTPEPEQTEDITDLTADPEPEESSDEEQTDEEDPQSVNIIMVGDILLHTPVEEAARDDETGKYDFSFIFDHSRDVIGNADIAIVNQEVIIGGEELKISGYPAFNAPYEIRKQDGSFSREYCMQLIDITR